MIEFQCSNCGICLTAEQEYAGASADCPSCGGSLIVPNPGTENLAIPHEPSVSAAGTTSPPIPSLYPKQTTEPPLVPGLRSTNSAPVRNSGPFELKMMGVVAASVIAIALFFGKGGSKGTPQNESAQASDSGYSVLTSVPCSHCGGTGQSNVSCTECYGARTIKAPSGFEMACPKCNGMAIVTAICDECEGSGRISSSDDELHASPKPDSMQYALRQSLAQRYRGDSSLQYEVDAGVRSLHEVYPELSIQELIVLFEKIGLGGTRIVTNSQARSSRIMVEDLIQSAKAAGMEPRELIDLSLQAQDRMLPHVNKLFRGQED